MRDDPTLQGKPVIIGGPPNSRAVVCTASYAARRYGVHSAMPCAKAVRLCPQAIFIMPNFAKYYAVSQQIQEIFRKYTPLIEPLSLDEAYLDVTKNSLDLYAVKIALLIQEEIFQKLKLTGSAGVAPNKLLAKIASDMRKPNGITVVLPEGALNFMEKLPLRKIHGIGPVTEKRLAHAGLKSCRDVYPYSLADLEAKIGKMAEWLYSRARGIDEREVEVNWVRKSLGREETFAKDLLAIEELKAELAVIVDSVATRLQNKNLKGKTITLKIRYDDFSRITRSHSLLEPTANSHLILKVVEDLLRETDAGKRKIRLLGVTLSNLAEK